MLPGHMLSLYHSYVQMGKAHNLCWKTEQIKIQLHKGVKKIRKSKGNFAIKTYGFL